jgi:hypothetical protein
LTHTANISHPASRGGLFFLITNFARLLNLVESNEKAPRMQVCTGGLSLGVVSGLVVVLGSIALHELRNGIALWPGTDLYAMRQISATLQNTDQLPP